MTRETIQDSPPFTACNMINLKLFSTIFRCHQHVNRNLHQYPEEGGCIRLRQGGYEEEFTLFILIKHMKYQNLTIYNLILFLFSN